MNKQHKQTFNFAHFGRQAFLAHLLVKRYTKKKHNELFPSL